MATRIGAYEENQLRPAALTVKWTGLLSGDDGDWMLLGHYRHKCLQIYGTNGGALVTLEGTNETGTPANPVPLMDSFGVPIAIAGLDSFLKEVHENPLKVRPRIQGGDGTTSITAVLVCRHG